MKKLNYYNDILLWYFFIFFELKIITSHLHLNSDIACVLAAGIVKKKYTRVNFLHVW